MQCDDQDGLYEETRNYFWSGRFAMSVLEPGYCSRLQGRIYSCGGPRTIKMLKPISVTTNGGNDNSFIIISYNN
jgi:hypothetical protein